MFDLIAGLLAFFYQIIPNYGIAIALLTLTVMLLLTPLTLKGTRSMMMMQAVQPEMKRLQQQYKDDRQKLNEELLKFYKENNINPISGCLPLLIQLPVFFILYRILAGLTRTVSFTYLDPATNGAQQRLGIDGLVHQAFDPSYVSKSSDLFKSLFGQTQMRSFGMDLSESVIKAASHSFGRAIPYLILIVGVFLTSVLQQRQISGRNPAAQANPQTQLMMKLGPTMITGFSIFAPGGLVIYFFVSNSFRCAQQALISHTIYKSPEAKALLERQHKEAEERRKAEAGQPKKSFFERLLGDAAPQIKEQRQRAGKADSARKPSRTSGSRGADPSTSDGAAPAKATGSNGSSRTSAPRPPLAKSGGGRTTPQGNRSSTSRKKRKRK